MKNQKYIILLSLLSLTGCSSTTTNLSLPEVTDNKVKYTDVYSIETTFEKNTNTLTDDKKQDTINYFLSNGSHYAKGTDYIFLLHQEINGGDFKVTLSYDSSLEKNPFFFACTYFLDDTASLPDAYYFFSTNFNLTDFKNIDFTSYYCYDYEDDKTTKNASVGITYTDIDYGTCPMINSATFTRGTGTEFPSRAVKKDAELGAAAFECVRVGISYLDKLLQTVSSNYHIW